MRVIASSVIRTSQKGEAHGGLYLVDLSTGECELQLDWEDPNISWKGRGGERGLRGIAVDDNYVYCAGAKNLYVLDRAFNLAAIHPCPRMASGHEVCLHDGLLYIADTQYDSVLVFDTGSRMFLRGYCLRGKRLRVFESMDAGPKRRDTLHVNNVHWHNGHLYVAGFSLGGLYRIHNMALEKVVGTPSHTHNARPFRDGVLYNYTKKDCVVYASRLGEVVQSWPVPRYEGVEDIPGDCARQAWGRGLCVKDNLVITGSSPATIQVYDLEREETVKIVNISMDVRNAIHGLELWE
jgi:hypothetical protein